MHFHSTKLAAQVGVFAACRETQVQHWESSVQGSSFLNFSSSVAMATALSCPRVAMASCQTVALVLGHIVHSVMLWLRFSLASQPGGAGLQSALVHIHTVVATSGTYRVCCHANRPSSKLCAFLSPFISSVFVINLFERSRNNHTSVARYSGRGLRPIASILP